MTSRRTLTEDFLRSVYPSYPVSPRPPGTLRVVSYNVHGFVDLYGKDTTQTVSSWLESLDADIVCLQEASEVLDIPSLPYFIQSGWVHTYSSSPIESLGEEILPASEDSRCRRLLTGRTRGLTVSNTHLHPGNHSVARRQLKYVLQYRPEIICGDFNLFNPHELSPVRLQSHPPAHVPSSPLDFPGYEDYLFNPGSNQFTHWSLTRIDYIIGLRKFFPVSTQVVGVDFSDHLPVVVDLERVG